MESFRKAYGALKDSTKVGLASLNSDFKVLDVAIVKATNHVECPPKERHVGKILAAISANRPRADVGYCIHALCRRLSKTRNWIVAIKTLIVVHRTLREGDPAFREELVRYSQRGKLFQLYNFKDDSSTLAWDCSAWVRTYSLFLEERVECFKTLQYDLEVDRASKPGPQVSKTHSKTRFLNGDQLLEHLPSLQQLMYRLICCQPEGLACHNYLVQFALAMVLKESFRIYCSINDGIINLVDLFFDMPKHDAVRALDIYRRAGKQAAHLADFYGFCRTLDLARTFHFPTLKQPPPTFLATMEDYIKEAPHISSLSDNRLEYRETENESEDGDEEEPQEETEKQVQDKEDAISAEEEEEPSQTESPPLVNVPNEEHVDLLGLSEVNKDALKIEESNALALAIFEPGANPPSANNALAEIGSTSGWELAIVTAPSNTSQPQVAQPQMAGGFDNLLLDSLYEDSAARRTMELHSAGYSTSYGYDPSMQIAFNQQQQQQFDPFAMSSNIPPPTNVQMALLAQQEQMTMHQQLQQQQQQQMMMMPTMEQHQGMSMEPYNPYAASQPMGGYFNPFGDPFNYPQPAAPPHGKNDNTLI
ncbi:putative clathrin assembly protein At5g57200 [Salvia miltiorrhiza]|uniref:putative clathrin assembly protein At5g57200 n=1 Tax=Salvia miltiorrhiza TaxID=226208 RepID=UPI0025AD57C4|nr:putative clathrin assembly protein At5g57200 [Salvia miltiorrhiza]